MGVHRASGVVRPLALRHVPGIRVEVQGSGFRVQGSGFRVQGAGVIRPLALRHVSGIRFEVYKGTSSLLFVMTLEPRVE